MSGNSLGVPEQEDSLATRQETDKDDARTQLFELYPGRPVGEDEVTRKKVRIRLRCRARRDGPWICLKERGTPTPARRRQRESDTTPHRGGWAGGSGVRWQGCPALTGNCKIQRRHARIRDAGRLFGTLGLAGFSAGMDGWREDPCILASTSFFSWTFFKYTLEISSLLGWLGFSFCQAKIKTCPLKLAIS